MRPLGWRAVVLGLLLALLPEGVLMLAIAAIEAWMYILTVRLVWGRCKRRVRDE